MMTCLVTLEKESSDASGKPKEGIFMGTMDTTVYLEVINNSITNQITDYPAVIKGRK